MNRNLFSNNSFLRLLSSMFLISVSVYSVVEIGTILILTISILIFLLTYEYVSFTETIDTLFLKTTKSFLNVTIFLLSIFTIYFSIIFYFIVFLLYLFQKNTSKVNNIFVFIGPIYLCLPFIFLYNIRLSNSGLDIILWFLLIVWSTDSFSYIGGNIFGGKKLILSLSPNKTWSGWATLQTRKPYRLTSAPSFNVKPNTATPSKTKSFCSRRWPKMPRRRPGPWAPIRLSQCCPPGLDN